jgi:hypothetical protein
MPLFNKLLKCLLYMYDNHSYVYNMTQQYNGNDVKDVFNDANFLQELSKTLDGKSKQLFDNTIKQKTQQRLQRMTAYKEWEDWETLWLGRSLAAIWIIGLFICLFLVVYHYAGNPLMGAKSTGDLVTLLFPVVGLCCLVATVFALIIWKGSA